MRRFLGCYLLSEPFDIRKVQLRAKSSDVHLVKWLELRSLLYVVVALEVVKKWVTLGFEDTYKRNYTTSA